MPPKVAPLLLILFSFVTLMYLWILPKTLQQWFDGNRILLQKIVIWTADNNSTSSSSQLEHISSNTASIAELLALDNTPKFYDMTNGEGRRNRIHLYANYEHKFMYCFIQKNANTMFRNLWLAVDRHDPYIYHIDTRQDPNDTTLPFHDHLQIYRLPVKQILNLEYWKYMQTVLLPDWIKIVVIRDPLERLLSGYLDRCLWVVETYGLAKECFGNITDEFTFADFVHRVINMTEQQEYITNPHYWPQSWFCRLNKFVRAYQYVIQYDYHSIGEKTLRLLETLNLSEYYYHWGEHGNETMFEDSVHVTYKGGNQLETRVAFYSQHYTKELAIKCLKLYHDDYKLFHLPYPDWIHHL